MAEFKLTPQEAKALATEAGVTVSTVGRWLGGLGVHESSRRCIVEALARLGFALQPTIHVTGANSCEVTHRTRGPLAAHLDRGPIA